MSDNVGIFVHIVNSQHSEVSLATRLTIFCPRYVGGVEFHRECLLPGASSSSGLLLEEARCPFAEKGRLMSKQVIEVVLPRLAKTLYRELRRVPSGQAE